MTSNNRTVDQGAREMADAWCDDLREVESLVDDLAPDDDESTRMAVDRLLDEVRKVIREAVEETWQEATTEAELDAHCWSADDHAELVADEYGVTVQEVAAMQEDYAVWPAFVADLRAGFTLDAALQRLPVQAYWRVT